MCMYVRSFPPKLYSLFFKTKSHWDTGFYDWLDYGAQRSCYFSFLIFGLQPWPLYPASFTLVLRIQAHVLMFVPHELSPQPLTLFFSHVLFFEFYNTW